MYAKIIHGPWQLLLCYGGTCGWSKLVHMRNVWSHPDFDKEQAPKKPSSRDSNCKFTLSWPEVPPNRNRCQTLCDNTQFVLHMLHSRTCLKSFSFQSKNAATAPPSLAMVLWLREDQTEVTHNAIRIGPIQTCTERMNRNRINGVAKTPSSATISTTNGQVSPVKTTRLLNKVHPTLSIAVQKKFVYKEKN